MRKTFTKNNLLKLCRTFFFPPRLQRTISAQVISIKGDYKYTKGGWIVNFRARRTLHRDNS